MPRRMTSKRPSQRRRIGRGRVQTQRAYESSLGESNPSEVESLDEYGDSMSSEEEQSNDYSSEEDQTKGNYHSDHNGLESSSEATDSDEEIERVLRMPSDKVLGFFLLYGVQTPIIIVLTAMLSQYRWNVVVSYRLWGALTVLDLSILRTYVLPPLAALLFPVWWWRNIRLQSSWCRILDAPKCQPSKCRLLGLASLIIPVDIVLSCWLFLGFVHAWLNSHNQHMPGGLVRIAVIELILASASCVAGPVVFIRLRKLRREKPQKRQYRLVSLEEGQGTNLFQARDRSSGFGQRRQIRSRHEASHHWSSITPNPGQEEAVVMPESHTEDQADTSTTVFDTRPAITQVLLRPLEMEIAKVMQNPSEFEVLWSSSFGSSADMHFRTALTPRLHSVCATLSKHGFHVIAKGQGKIFFAARETFATRSDLVSTHRAGYTTSRKGYSDDEITKYSLCLGELRLAQTGMRCDLRCDGPLRLYANEIEKLLRTHHHVTGVVEKHGV